MIPYGRQQVSQEDIDAVCEVLKSDWLTQGPVVERFERAFADFCGVRYAVAVSNGTAALHLSCLALDVKGREVWTSPNTFVASANGALYAGGKVDFVDIDPRTYNLSPAALEEKLTRSGKGGREPAAVIPVHFAGQSCDMEKIGRLAKKYGFSVVEDACHAVGATFAGKRVGVCANSDIAVFSFHPVKIITSGEGGMVVTNRADLYERLLALRSHGIVRDVTKFSDQSHGDWYYEQHSLGYNYRITDIQAALGASQLRRVENFVRRRREIAKRYDAELSGLPLALPWQDDRAQSSWHLYVVRLRLGALEKSRQVIFDELRAAGIGVNVHYIPVHWQPYYRALGFDRGSFPESERYYEEALTLPIYAALTDEQQSQIIHTLTRILA